MVAKQSKAAKNYKRNKKLVSSKIKSRKVLQQRTREESIKNKKLLEEETPDTEQQEQLHEQQYLQQSSKSKVKKAVAKETPLTGADVASFLKSLKEGDMDSDDKDDIQALINDIDDPYMLDMTKENQDGREDGSDEEEEDEDVEDSDNDNDGQNTEDGQQQTQNTVDDDSDDEEFMNIPGEEEEDADIDPSKKVITRDMISNWIAQMGSDKPLHAAKQMILAFLSAVSKDNSEISTPYQITNKSTYQRVIIASTKYLARVFNKELKLKNNIGQRVPKKTTKVWKQIHTSVLIYLKSLYLLLETIADDKLLEYILKDLQASIHLFGNFPKKVTRLLKCLLNLLNHEKETIRFSSFLLIHKMATVYPFPFISTCLKGVYFTLIEKSSTYRAHNHVPIEFMKNCIVELCGIDLSVSYKFAFMSLRELAVQLRGAYESKPHAYLKCYNWTFLNCVHVWVKTICAYQKQDELRDLLYPLVQITVGCITANTTVKYFNARLKCLSMLNELMRHITSPKLYIPVLPHIFGILNSEIGQKKNKKYNTGDLIDMDFKLRMRTSQAITVEYQRHILESALYYMIEFFALNSRSIAFPELAYPAERFLINYNSSSNIDPMFKKKIKNLVAELRKNADLVMEKRSKVAFSPLDIEKSQNFMNVDEDKQLTPLEKLFAFEKNIRDQEIVDRIQARLGKGVTQVDENYDTDEDDSDEELTNEEKDERANPLPQGYHMDDDEEEAVSATKQLAQKRARPQQISSKKKQQPPAKKRKISKKDAQRDQDVVQELDLDDF